MSISSRVSLAVERLKIAIKQAHDAGVLGKNILDPVLFWIDIVWELVLSVCGEEKTALITLSKVNAVSSIPNHSSMNKAFVG